MIVEYCQLPHGNSQERLGVLGLGMGGIQNCPENEIEEVVRTAIANGINFFDLCAGGKNIYVCPKCGRRHAYRLSNGR